MKKSLFKRIKTSSLFYKKDIFLYLFVCVFVLALFFGFVFFADASTPDGFKAIKGGQTVFSFNFDKNDLTVSQDFTNLVKVENSQNLITVTVYTDDKYTDYNVVEIDKVNLTAKVTDSTCSISKDCVRSPKIKGNGAIYCAPHDLKIVGLGGFVPPVSG